jgi:hypothetical protein
MGLTLEDRIRWRAYFLWLNDGDAGDESYYWLIAEREVLAEVAMEPAATPPEAIQSVQAAKPTAVVHAIERACAGAITHVSKHRQLFVSQSPKPTRRQLKAASRYSPRPTSLHLT